MQDKSKTEPSQASVTLEEPEPIPEPEPKVEISEFPAETLFNEGRYEVEDLFGREGKLWIYYVEDKEEKFKRYKRKIMKITTFEIEGKGILLDSVRIDQLRVLKSVENPSANVVRYLDVFVDEIKNCVGFVSEISKLSNFESKIKKREYDFKNSSIINWSLQILKGIEFLHSHKIVHFDIRPANVFLTPRNYAKLGDLPLSVPTLDSYVAEGTGSLNYFSPELINGSIAKMTEKEKEKSDIWSFGCIVYELIHLKKAFENEDLRELAMSIVNCNVDMPENTEETFDYLLKNTLKKYHKERLQAKDMINYIEEKIQESFDRPVSAGLNPYNHDLKTVLSSLQCIETLTSHYSEVSATHIYEDNISKEEFLISASQDKTVRIWNIDSAECVRKIEIEEDQPLCLTDMFKKILFMGSANHNQIRTWKLESGIRLDDLPVENATAIHSMMLYKETNLLIGTNRSIEIRKVNIGTVVTSTLLTRFTGHTGSVMTMIYYDNETKFISGSSDATIRIWSIDDQRSSILFGHEKPVLALALSEQTRLISSSADKTIMIWNLKNGSCLRTLKDHNDWVTCLLIRKERLISGSDDHCIRVWDIDTRECIKTLREHEMNVCTLKLSKNGKLISSASDGVIKIWQSY